MWKRHEGLPKEWAKTGCTSGKKHEMRKWMWLSQEKKCFWCGKLTVLPELFEKGLNRPDLATFEHLMSRTSSGWHNLTSNLVIACSECNHMRGNKGIKKTIKWISNMLKRKRQALDHIG